MNELDWAKFNKSQAEMQDCIAAANISELREIDHALDDLREMIEDNVSALSGACGDY